MQLYIKNEDTCALARKLAKLTGESLTRAVHNALTEKLEAIALDNPASRIEEGLVDGHQ